MCKILAFLFPCLILNGAVFAQQSNPFACLGEAEAASKGKSVGEIRVAINDKLVIIRGNEEAKTPVDAEEYCVVAELMKRVGDYRATAQYLNAINAKEDEPLYEYLLAEYLRNFRGALHPLFPESEKHYYKGLQKFEQILKKQPFDYITEKLVKRGLSALSQTDGLPILHRKSDSLENGGRLDRPVLYFTMDSEYARNTSDFDRRIETRDYTSESLLFKQRLNRDLSEDELRGIIRAKDQFETFSRLRFRHGKWPAIDFTYKYREIYGGQITNFFSPGQYNDVNLSEAGIAIERSINAQIVDLFLRGSFKRAQRKGTIEFEPGIKEDINQVEATAVLSRFIGPDKANLEFTYVYQDINENRRAPQKRDRSIYAAKFTYQLFRPALKRAYNARFDPRGADWFAGVLHDNETFGDVDVNRNDYFVGASLRGIGPFDFTLQPTLYTSDVIVPPSLFDPGTGPVRVQNNSQLRTNANVLIRILDEERKPKKEDDVQPGNPAFLHLVIPFSRDITVTGPSYFENYKIGAEINAKLFALGKHRTTFLASVRYGYQNFHRLRKGINLYSISFSMGF